MDTWKEVPYHATPLADCNFCGSRVVMMQHTSNRTVDFAVSCTMGEGESPLGDACPLQDPPDQFNHATRREAAKYWNEWAALGASRRVEQQRASA